MDEWMDGWIWLSNVDKRKNKNKNRYKLDTSTKHPSSIEQRVVSIGTIICPYSELVVFLCLRLKMFRKNSSHGRCKNFSR